MVEPRLTTVTPESKTREDPILFVHGAWHGAWCWEPFQEWFAARGWTTHAVDLRGHGHTPNDRSLRRTRIHHYVDDLRSAIAGLDRAPLLVAHSMGALVAQRALEQSEVRGAVLVTPVPLGGVGRATLRTLRRHPLAFLMANLTWSLAPLVRTPQLARDLFLSDDAADKDLAWLHERLQSESYPAYLDMLFFVRARPQLVPAPVRVVAAERDRIFSVAEATKLAHAYGPEPTVLDSAHDAMLGYAWETAAEAVEELLVELTANTR